MAALLFNTRYDYKKQNTAKVEKEAPAPKTKKGLILVALLAIGGVIFWKMKK